MKIHRSIVEPIRLNANWEERWNGADQGLVACWERGCEKSLEDLPFASQARDGQLVLLPWKGGVERAVKAKRKFGSLNYLAMWQGLRGDDLNIDTEEETMLICTVTKMIVVFTNDRRKYVEA
jgi:hypothetical protein